MTDRPIIFSAPVIRALLDGRKVQTRRILKRQDWSDAIVKRFPNQKEGVPYAPGDRLWVRERMTASGSLAAYFAGGRSMSRQAWWKNFERKDLSPLAMPRSASRLTLIVESVRVQRLQEIEPDDVRREGIFMIGEDDGIIDSDATIAQFALLWESIHGPDAWEANPWVAALTFRVERANIDALPGEVG